MHKVQEKKHTNQKVVKVKLSELQKEEVKFSEERGNKGKNNFQSSGKKVVIQSDDEDSPRRLDSSGQVPNVNANIKPIELLVSGFIPKNAPSDIEYISISSNGSKK